jgi:hypothetical protein
LNPPLTLSLSVSKGVQREVLEKLENEKEKDAIIDHRLHRSIIGSKCVISEICRDFKKVVITFPNPSEKSDIVKIRGPKNDVEQCYKHLMKLVKDLQESNIKKIRNESAMKIDLPAEGDKNEVSLRFA